MESVSQRTKRQGIMSAISIPPQVIVGLVDLTLLDADATETQLETLCSRAAAHKTAAICVLPQHVAKCRGLLPVDGPVALATTPGGFPIPYTDLEARIREVKATISAGATEVDVVLEPGQDWDEAETHLKAIREASTGVVMKVILETPLRTDDDMRRACRLCLQTGTDILKTCTGKRGSADARAVRILAEEIAAFAAATGRQAALKISGGVRTTSDAVALLTVAREADPALQLTSRYLRIGASGLLDALLADIAGTTHTVDPSVKY
jgi:deoxyribose-phosphate aldolase